MLDEGRVDQRDRTAGRPRTGSCAASRRSPPEVALRLGKLCGSGPEFWLRMQMRRDLWRLERTLAADLARTYRAA